MLVGRKSQLRNVGFLCGRSTAGASSPRTWSLASLRSVANARTAIRTKQFFATKVFLLFA